MRRSTPRESAMVHWILLAIPMILLLAAIILLARCIKKRGDRSDNHKRKQDHHEHIAQIQQIGSLISSKHCQVPLILPLFSWNINNRKTTYFTRANGKRTYVMLGRRMCDQEGACIKGLITTGDEVTLPASAYLDMRFTVQLHCRHRSVSSSTP